MAEQKTIIEKVAEGPAVALQKAIESSEHAARAILSKEPVRDAEAYWRGLGPGLVTGASDDDPSGIATYSQVGAQYGFSFLWMAPFTFPLMAVIQEMCARIGLATGRGLAGNIRERFAPGVLYACTALLLIANIVNLGADLGAMSQAAQLIFPGANFFLLVFGFTIISLGLQVFTVYSRYARYLKYLSLVLLLYIVSTFTLGPLDWSDIVHHTIVPQLSFSKDWLLLFCAILGTTISPYLFFWQTSQEVEERRLAGKILVRDRHAVLHKSEVKRMRVDVWSGMFLSNVVMYFIILVCGAVLFSSGVQIQSAADAAAALRPLAGNNAYILFALGIIGTGLLAVPVLAGSVAYAAAETMHWKSGLYRKLKDAHAFYGVIIIAMLLGALMNVLHINPFRALIYSAVLNGVVAPVILICIVLLSSNKKVMGRWANKPLTTVIGWVVVVLMLFAGVGAIASFI
jgi:NRAMP (natural resistance-associated macrophage protein)-like metal ion transporter